MRLGKTWHQCSGLAVGDPERPVIGTGRFVERAEVWNHRCAVRCVVTNSARRGVKLFAHFSGGWFGVAFRAIAAEDNLAVGHGELHVLHAAVHSGLRDGIWNMRLDHEKFLAVRSIDTDVFGKDAELPAKIEFQIDRSAIARLKGPGSGRKFCNSASAGWTHPIDGNVTGGDVRHSEREVDVEFPFLGVNFLFC